MTALSQFLATCTHLPKDVSVYVSGCAAEVPGLAQDLASVPGDSVTVNGIFIPGVNRCDYTAASSRIYCKTFFMTPQLFKSVTDRVDYYPWRYREIIRHFQQSQIDIAIVTLSPPDSEGYCSYSVTSDFAPLILPRAKVRVGVLNSNMPRTHGARVRLADLTHWVTHEFPLLTTPEARLDDRSRAIARYVATLVDNGATNQLGLGSISGAVITELVTRRNLRVHSGVIESSLLSLENAGALDRDFPVLSGVALGSSQFFSHLNENPRFLFEPVSVTHDERAITSSDNFIAINGALQVDLLGQTNSCVLSDGFTSGPGGLPEFANGALVSRNGRSIIALHATAVAGQQSRIVASLSGGLASLSASDADVVVTEFGIAELRGKSVAQRVDAMIAVADPAHRAALSQAALSARWGVG